MAVLFDSSKRLTHVRVWNGAVETWYDSRGNVLSDWSHASLGAQAIGRIDNRSEFELSFHNGLQHFMGSIDFKTGDINTAFVYGPYGEVIEETNNTATPMHLRRFNGKEADQLSRLNYYGYRYYDPLSLTWTQADPLYRVAPDLAYDQPRRMSLYLFSGNNPVHYMDPDGRDLVDNGTGCITKGGCENLEGTRASGMEGVVGVFNIVTSGVQRIGRGIGETAAMISEGQYIAAGDRAGEVAKDVAIEATISVAFVGAGKVLEKFVDGARAAKAIEDGVIDAARGGDDAVSVFHGSINDASKIRSSGLDPGRAPTFVTRDRAAALDAIGPNRYDVAQGAARDIGLIESRIPGAAFDNLLAPAERGYGGFFGSGLSSSEIVLRTKEAIKLFNDNIVR